MKTLEELLIKEEIINEVVKKVKNPKTGKMQWALVSKKTGKPLNYYEGEGKPSEEWIKKAEKIVKSHE